jgi:glycosyltransferase involved in cell wall biosynthesis
MEWTMSRWALLFVSLLLPFLAQSKEKICLNMIVKNEKDVIRRCLDSVMPLIDYWVIVDTGSTDGTQEIIKTHLEQIPGELYERPWRNFGENRSEAYDLAKGKGDYILFMDADDILEYEPGFHFSNLTDDLYMMWRGSKGHSYQKPQLAKADLPWRWVGVTHEYLDCPFPHSSALLTDVKYTTLSGGASAKNPRQKFMRNVKLLREGLLKEPDNVRYMFYLAESYRDAGEKGKALEWFQKRVDRGGWDEEVFWSKLQIGHLLRDMGLPREIVIESYKDAHRFRPHRAEPMYYIAEIYNKQGEHQKAYDCIQARKLIPKPQQKDILFNEDWIDHYGLLFQESICSYYLGLHRESLEACNQLLTIEDLPEGWRKQTENNRTFPLAKLEKKKKKR